MYQFTHWVRMWIVQEITARYDAQLMFDSDCIKLHVIREFLRRFESNNKFNNELFDLTPYEFGTDLRSTIIHSAMAQITMY